MQEEATLRDSYGEILRDFAGNSQLMKQLNERTWVVEMHLQGYECFQIVHALALDFANTDELDEFFEPDSEDGSPIWPYFTDFALALLDELRKALCEGTTLRKAAKVGDVAPQAVCATIGAYITTRFGIEEPVAVGLAAATIYILLTATRGAFCRMTKAEIEKRVGPVIKDSRRIRPPRKTTPKPPPADSTS